MGFDDFIGGLLDAALGGPDGTAPMRTPPTAPPSPGAFPAAAQQLPPEIIAALTAPFAPSVSRGLSVQNPLPIAPPPGRSKETAQPKPRPKDPYRIPPGSFAGPAVPDTLPDVQESVLPQYMISYDDLPQDLLNYQFGEGEEKKYIYLPDKSAWLPVPSQFFQQLLGNGIVNPDGTPVAVDPLPDLSDPSDEDIKKWQNALPIDLLNEIKTDAENDVTLFSSQLDALYNDSGRTFDKDGQLIDSDALSNQIQALETKLDEAKSEVSDYEALAYILYGVEPPQSKKEWVISNIVSPIMDGLGTYFSLSDLGRSQLGRRLGGTLLGEMATGNTAKAAMIFAALRSTGIGGVLLDPLWVAAKLSDKDIGKIYKEDGSIAVWEQVIADLPDEENWPGIAEFAWHAYTDTAYDPLTYLPAASAASVSMRGAKTGSPIMRGIGAVLEPTIRYTDIATSLPGTALFRGTAKIGRAVKTAASNVPYWKVGKAFAPSRGGTAKLMRESMGASAHKLEQAAEEFEQYQIGRSIGPPGSGGPGGITPYTPGSPQLPVPPGGGGNITPFPQPGITPGGAPGQQNLTTHSLTNTPPAPTTQQGVAGPQVIGGTGGSQPVPGTTRTTSQPERLTLLEKAINQLDQNENITPQQLARKLRVKVADAKDLLDQATTARDALRGPVQVYPATVRALRPHANNKRILDVGYQSFLRGEDRGRKFIEEANPILERYDNDPVFNSRLSQLDEGAGDFGERAWPQKARAMSFVADIAEVYARYFNDLSNTNNVRVSDVSYRGNALGANDAGGLKAEFTETLIESYALADLSAERLSAIERILRNTTGHYIDVTSSNGKTYTRAVGGLKSADTGGLPKYAEDVLSEIKDARKRFDAALVASRKASAPPAQPADGFVPVESALVDSTDDEIESSILDAIDNAGDERTPNEVLGSVDQASLDEEVSYPGNPTGGLNSVDTVIVVEDIPESGSEVFEVVETSSGTTVIVHKNKPSRRKLERRRKAALETQRQENGLPPSGAAGDEVAETKTASQRAADLLAEQQRLELTDDAAIPSNATIMTPSELATWREQNVFTTVITGPRGEVIETINRMQDGYIPSEGEVADALSDDTPSIAQPREHVSPPVDPAEIFPTQQRLYSIGSEESWRKAGLNTPDSNGKPTSYANFRSNVVPKKDVDLTNKNNKHVRYFRNYLRRANGLPEEALLDNGNRFAEGYEVYEKATDIFWDTMVRFARSQRTSGLFPEDFGIDRRGFFKSAPGKAKNGPATPALTQKQQENLKLFDEIFFFDKDSSIKADTAKIEIPQFDADGTPIDVGVDMFGVPGTNLERGTTEFVVYSPNTITDKEINYTISSSPKFDPDELGPDIDRFDTGEGASLTDAEIKAAGKKYIVSREIHDPVTLEGESVDFAFVDSAEEAKLKILKDFYLLNYTDAGLPGDSHGKFIIDNPPLPDEKSASKKKWYHPKNNIGIVGPSFHQLSDLSDMLNGVGYAARSAKKQVPVERMQTYRPTNFRKDVMNYAGQMGHLNNDEVVFWDKRIDLDLATEELMSSSEKKLLGRLQEGLAVDPAKIAVMDEKQRAYLINVFGIAAGIKNPLTYPKRVVLTDKVMMDVIGRVDRSQLGPRATKILDGLGQTAAQQSKLGNIYLAARRFGLNERESEDFILKVANLYTGPPGAIQNWDTGVRHAYMYNLPKAPFNVAQDTLNDALIGVFDGDPDAVGRWAKLFVEQIKSNVAGKEGRIFDRYAKANTPVLDEIRAFNEAVGETVYPSVQSQRGGRYDDVAGRYVEDGKSWWETKGDSFGKWLDSTAFRGRTGTKLQSTFRFIGQAPAPSSVLRLRNSMDDMKRLGVDHTYSLKHYGEAVDAFLSEDLNRVARKVGRQRGVSMDGQVLLDQLMAGSQKTFYGMPIFSPKDVRALLEPLVGKGQSEHLARKWASRTGALKAAAAKQTDKMLYSYTPTNIDEQVSRLWMFHYWATRASTTHARLALENPFIMAAYYRMFEGTKRAAEERGDLVPGWAKLFVPLQAGPYGMLGLVSPAAILSGLSVVLDLQGIAPNDFSWVDAMQVLPMRPIIAAAMAMTVSDRPADPSGTAQTRRYVQTAVNFFRNTGISPIDPGMTNDFVANATYRLQAMGHRVFSPLPGVDPLATPSPGERDTQDVKFYAIQIMQDRGIYIDESTGEISDEAAGVLANIDSGIYSGPIESEALRQFSIDMMYGSIGKSFLFTSMYPGVEGGFRSLAASAREAENAKPQPDLTEDPSGLGDIPTFVDVTPDATPEQDAAQLAVRLADAGGKEATELVATMAQFKKIGDDETRETYEAMNDAIYEPSSVIEAEWGGDGIAIGEYRFFSWDEWDRMPEGERREWMNIWLKQIGQDDDIDRYIQSRDSFAAAHPVIQGYLDWQSAVNKIGPKAFLERILRDSEGFRSWWSSRTVAPKDIRSVLMTESAYLAAQGNKPSLYDPVDSETAETPPLSSVLPPGGSSQSSDKKSWTSMDDEERANHLMEQERIYMVRLQEFDDTIRSITGGVSYSALAPVSKRDVDIRLERMGIAMPEPGGQYARYLRWADAQPMGSDVSVQAYLSSDAADQ